MKTLSPADAHRLKFLNGTWHISLRRVQKKICCSFPDTQVSPPAHGRVGEPAGLSTVSSDAI
jgi:hypothetical protein